MASAVVNPAQSTPPPDTGTASPDCAARVYLPDVDHDVFKHFRLIKVDEGKSQQYECRNCCNVFSGAAIRFAQHLASWRKMKRREVALCKEAPTEARVAMRKKYEAKAAAAAQRRQATSDAIASVTSSGKRSRITDFLETGAEAGKRDAHEALALMFAGCRIPERIAEHPLFINAVRASRDAGTGYVPPNRRFIGGAGLRMCCDNIDRGLSGVKASWKRTGVTVASERQWRGVQGQCGLPHGDQNWRLCRQHPQARGGGGRSGERGGVLHGRWWHGTDAPKLAALAIRTLSQAVSASPCERGWSTWDGVHTARRNRLGSAKCRDLVFVAHNWNVVRNWHSRADVMPGVVLGNMTEPPMPEGYNVVEGDEEEEEGDDIILEDEYELGSAIGGDSPSPLGLRSAVLRALLNARLFPACFPVRSSEWLPPVLPVAPGRSALSACPVLVARLERRPMDFLGALGRDCAAEVDPASCPLPPAGPAASVPVAPPACADEIRRRFEDQRREQVPR
ncbi:unnamed protein product [Closterium sp. NIES-54]